MPRCSAVLTAVALGLSAVADSAAAAPADPVRLDRVLWDTGYYFWPTHDDYNADGVDDVIARVGPGNLVTAQIRSGVDGSLIRTYTLPPNSTSNWEFTRATTLPDSDGDGKREILVGDPEHVWAVRSSAGGGRPDLLPQVFSFNGLPFGQHVTTSDASTVIASGDESRLLVVDPRTGQVQARISNNVPYGNAIGSLGQSAVNLGDLNGDNVDDFASSGGNVNHFPNPTGSVFLLSGAVRTTGAADVALSALPAGSVLAELTGADSMGSGSAGNWQNTTVNLGDPRPANGVAEFLIVTTGPYRNSMVAHVLTRQPDNALAIARVAAYESPIQYYGEELVSLGDVTGDGVADLALHTGEYKVNNALVGRIEIIDGAALLDGFDPAADVIQRIDGLPAAFFHGSMHGLGDYDNDGRFEFAATVLYNGEAGLHGYAQHVFEVVPEPTSPLAAAVFGCAWWLRRRSRHAPVAV